MGIGRQQARALIDAVRSGTANRRAMRVQLGDAINLLGQFVAALDAQEAGAEKGFAAQSPGALNTYVAALPEPAIDQTP